MDLSKMPPKKLLELKLAIAGGKFTKEELCKKFRVSLYQLGKLRRDASAITSVAQAQAAVAAEVAEMSLVDQRLFDSEVVRLAELIAKQMKICQYSTETGLIAARLAMETMQRVDPKNPEEDAGLISFAAGLTALAEKANSVGQSLANLRHRELSLPERSTNVQKLPMVPTVIKIVGYGGDSDDSE